MRHTMQYSVNGQTMDVGADENDQFMQAAAERGYKPEAVHTYRINNETMQVPESQLDDFMSASKQRGYEPQRIQRLTMDDGDTVYMTEKDIEDFAYNAANGFRISRKDMERAGVPQMKVRSAADRAKFGTELAQMFHPEYFGNLAPQETPVVEANFGMRNDGKTYKGTGWLGVLKTADGGVATEYTSQSNAVTDRDGNRIDFPTLVPTLTEEEVGVMLNDIIPNKKPVPDSIMQKAVDHALEMQRRGRSVFANDGAAPKQNLGIWETLRQQKQNELGKEIGDAELTATLLPGIGTIMSAAERGKESNEQRLYFGNYADPLEASRLALAVGIPQETVAQINAKASAGQMPRRPFGGLDSDQYDMKVLGDEYKKLMNDALKERIIARQNAGEQLSQNELNWLQNAAVGAVGAGAAIAEMANPIVASATLGASAMNRAARMENGPLELDENGNVRREAVRDQYGNVVTREDGSVIEKRGTDSDTAMLKGFAGAAVERVIWSGATAKAFKALPGGAKVASKIERGGFLKKNAGELAGMVAKSRLTELADEVVGLNVADSESGESFGDWLVKTANPVETVKTALELLPVHGAMKAFGKIKNYVSKDAREHMANVKKAREDIDKAIGEGRSKNLTDAEVLKLHELSTSDGLTQEKIDSFVSKVGKDVDASEELFSAAADFAKQMRGSGFRMSNEASDSLASDIVRQIGTERAKEVFDKAKVKFKNPKELDEPGARARIVGEAIEDVVGKQLDAGPAKREVKSYEDKFAENRRLRTPTRVGEKEIAEDQEARAMGRRIEAEGEAQRKAAAEKAQADYDEKMAAYEEARAKRAAEKKRGIAKEKLTPLPEKPTPPELRVEEQKKPVIEADLTENKTPRTYKAKGDDVVPNGMNTRLGLIREDVAAKIADIDPNIEIVGIDFHGSRLRGDNRKDSDLDAVVEFKGDWSESSVFDALHGKDILTIDGVKVDINPIRADKTGTLEDYMRQSRQYDFSKEFEKGAVGVGEGTKKSDLSKKTAQVGKETPENAKIVSTKVEKTDKRDISHSSHLDIYTPGDAPGGVEGARIVKSVSGKTGEKQFQIVLKNGESIDVGPVGKNGKFGIRKGDDIRGPFDTLGNAVRKANELYGGEKKPTKVPDGRGRMVDKPSWRTSKVDEVDADGKPLTESEKMVLRQMKALDFIDYNQGRITSRKEYEKVVKAFDDIESAQPFERGINGDVVNGSARRVAKVLATSNFATPEEKARFKKYYEVEPQPPQTRENAPSRAPRETKPMSRPEAAKPVEARNGANGAASKPKTYEEIAKRLDELTEAAKPKNGQKGDVVSPSPRVPDGKGRMVKKPAATKAQAASSAAKRTSATPDELKPLKDAIAEAKKSLADKKGVGTMVADKQFSVNVGTMDIKFGNTAEGIARAEKIANKLSVVKNWMPKDQSNKPPSAPKPLKVARGKDIGTFDDVAPDFIADKKDWRKELKAPFVKDGYVYATDGRSIIRMKADVGAKNTEGAPDAKKIFDANVGNPVEKFKIDASAESVPLEQARAATNKDFNGVEIWRSPDGKIVMRSRTADDTRESNSAFMNAPSLKGHDYLGKFDPDYIEKAFKTFAKLGVKDVNVEWSGATKPLYIHGGGAEVLIMPLRIGENGVLSADTKVQLLGGRRRMTDEQRAEAVNQQIADEIALAKENNPKITQTRILEIEDRIREAEKKAQEEIGKHNGNLDPMLQISEATPAQKLADPDFKAWARKQGRTPTDGARRIYDAQRVDAVFKVAKNWLNGVKMRRSENAAEVPNGARMLYSRDGNVIGWYDRAKKEVVTLPGADAATVAHELGWHATYDYAQAEAAQGRTALLDKLNDYAANAPQPVKNEILRKYGMATDAAVLLDEIGAARYTMDNVNKIKDAATRRQTAKWYQRTWNAIADTYKAMLSKLGWNKARLDNLSALTPEETVNLLADEMLKGRNLGKAKSTQIDMSKGESIAELHDRKLKDRLRPIEEIENDAGKSVGNSAYTLFRTLPGKVQGAIDKAQNFAEKVKADCKKAGIKIEELNEFLYASAASERNAKVLARNGRLDGSAMSHTDIQRILSAYRNSPKYAELRRIADDVLEFQRKGFDFRRKAGLISDETWNTLLADEPNHVPMKNRFDPNGEHTGFSLTEQFGKPEWKTAEGRTNVGDGPLEWIVQEYVDAFSRGHENVARRALLETVLAHPEVGEVKKLGPNDALGEVKRKGKQGDPNVFVVKTDGDTYQVKLNGTRGELIARAVSGRGLVRAPQSLQKAMRWWSAAATSWSPTFAVRNFLADTVDVFAVNIGEKGLVKGLGASGKHVKTALKLTNAIRKYASTGETTDPLIREAVDAGVLMGGGVRGQAFADAGEEALKTLKTDWRNGKNRIKAVRNAMFGWIDTLNQTAELMNRMADYKLQREAGKSKNEAALHAREITVDFNQKGELTPVTNMLYMFSNSTLGATMRLNKAIFASKEGKSLAAGTFAIGLIEGTVEAMVNGDDEDGKNMNEYTRANSFYFRKGKDIYRIPLHASPISVIKYAGNCTARKLFGTLKGDKAAKQIAKDMIGMMTSYLGIGALGDNEAAAIAPTIVQPFLQAYMNRDFADRPIERMSFSEEKPKSGNGRPSTPQYYHDLAKWLNELGGGNAGRKGEFLGVGTDFSPEMLKHFADATGKNALRDIENTVEFAKMVLGKTEWDRRNIPVGRDYFRTTGGNDNRFFEAVRAYKTDASDFKERTGADRKKFEDSHPWLKEGRDGRTTVNRLINMTNRDKPRDGVEKMGITQLRKLTEGKIRRNDGTYFKPNTPVSDELKERAKEWLQKRQARVIEIMGK